MCWDKVCKPLAEGGLGIRRLKEMNKAMLMKMAWEVLDGESDLSIFMRAKYFNKDGELSTYHKPTSIWTGIKEALEEVVPRSQWVIADGKNTDLWRHNWLGNKSLKQLLNISSQELKGCRAKVSDLLEENRWSIPNILQELMDSVHVGVNTVQKCSPSFDDYVVWCPDMKGNFSTKSAYDEIRTKKPSVTWRKFIWNCHIHPRPATLVWKILQKGVATDERVRKVGVHLASRCSLCRNETETNDHLFWHCSFSQRLWQWISAVFKKNLVMSLEDAMSTNREWSPRLKQMWNACIVAVLASIWKQRNKVLFEEKGPNIVDCKYYVRTQVKITGNLSRSHSYNSRFECSILQFWDVKPRAKGAPKIKTCIWIPPEPDVIKLNTDGAASGNPGPAGIGVSYRGNMGDFKLTMWKSIGTATSFWAECLAILEGVETAISRGWLRLWVETDSEAASKAFTGGNVPWQLQARWTNCTAATHQLKTIFREGNLTADTLAKTATTLTENERVVCEGRPEWIHKWEGSFQTFYRFQ